MTEIELPEHASDPKTRPVGILVGVVGIFLSVVTIASHRAHTEAVITRTESNDDWAFYQAKKIRANVSDAALTLLTALASDQSKAAEARARLEAARDKELGDTKQLRSKAEASEKKTDLEEVRALKFDIGEGLLELGLVLCSLFFLARNSFFPDIRLSSRPPPESPWESGVGCFEERSRHFRRRQRSPAAAATASAPWKPRRRGRSSRLAHASRGPLERPVGGRHRAR